MDRPMTSRGLEEEEMDRQSETSGPLLPVKKFRSKPSRMNMNRSVNSSSADDESHTGSSVISVKSLRKPEVVAPLPKLTDEEKLRAMLGYKDDDVNKKSIYLREDFCGACGVQHPNPALLDTYSLCEACLNCLRDQSHLRNRYQGVMQETPLEILFATYGDCKDSRKAFDVTARLQDYVNGTACADRMIFREGQRFDKIFGKDPSFDKPKQLRVRYRINLIHGCVVLDVMANNQIPEQIMLFCPTKRDLTILRGTYGHPRGRTTTGRMSYDIKENLQGIVDLHRGSFLYISAMQPIEQLFNDPCVGYVKDLQVEFDINGKMGFVEVGECHNRLKRKIEIQTAPSVSPMILVAHANYGITENTIKDRLKTLESNISKIDLLMHRRSAGLPIKVAERQFIKKRPIFVAERDDLKSVKPNHVDIRHKIQLMVGKQGGFELKLDKDEFDPNFTFGNPIPGKTKLLEISLVCYGHDSEQRTDSKEVTSKGYLRNFILGKKARYLVPVTDDAEGKGVMGETIHFETLNVLPLMHIEKAIYGHPSNIVKQFDVTTTIQNMVKGKLLVIDTDADLAKLFGDPCLGVRKVLKIFYCTRGFQGALRVREKNGCLVAAVEIGFEPEIGADTVPEQERPSLA